MRLGRGDTPTWTNVTGVQNIEWPDRVPADLDITNQASPGLAEENMPGLLPAIDWSVDLLLDDGSAGDTALTALNARMARQAKRAAPGRGHGGRQDDHLRRVSQGLQADRIAQGVVTMRATGA